MSCTRSIWDNRGSITVAAAIFLSSIIVLNTVLIDYVRMKTKISSIPTELQLACNSVLASYDALLADKYGLYGYNTSADTSAHRNFMRYYHAAESSVDFKEAFVEPDVLKEQICGIMQIKTPTNIIEAVLQAFDIISEADKSCDEHSVCGNAAQKLSDMQELRDKLKLKVEGYYSGDPACVNGFSQGVVLQLVENITKTENHSDKDTEIKMLLNQTIAVHKQYQQYNNEAAAICKELQIGLAEIESMLSDVLIDDSSPETLNNANSIKKQATTLLNNSALISLQHNAEVFKERIDLLERIHDKQQININQIKSILQKGFVHTNIRINTLYSGDGGGFSDQREALSGEIKNKVANSVFYNDKYEIPPMEYAMLPSVKAAAVSELASELIDSGAKDFMDKFSSFNSMFSYWDNVSFNEVIKDAASTILTDDYILSYMTTRLSGVSDDKLNNEIEYILCGNASCDANNDKVEQKIVALRFILNFTNIMRNKEKVTIAEAMAAAIAAVVSRGAGVTLYKYIIISAWALIDSYVDAEKLIQGESVPLLEIEGGDKVNEIQDYNFYLRILLLFTDTETKLLRICDIIEINMKEITGENYKLSSVYNSVCVKAVTEISYISPVLLGIEEKYRREDYCEVSY